MHRLLSLFAFFALLFFSLTGFFMNHGGWFELDETVEEEAIGQVSEEMLAGPDRLAIVERLRSEFGALGPLDECIVDEYEMVVMFKRPGRVTDAVINRETGEMRVYTETSNLFVLLGDIHRGENTGGTGGLLVDVSAGLLFLTALTGLALGLILPQSRRSVGCSTVLGGLGFAAWVALLFV